MTIPPFPLFASAAPSGATEYAHLRDADTDVADRARAFVRDAWARCSAYLDRDFARRFALEFHQRIWELRLCSTLLDLGWPLDSTCRGAGPDFLVPMCEGPRAWIEATATLHGDGRERVIEPPRHTGAILHDDERGVMLRYANALSSKRAHLQRAIDKGRVAAGDAVVIAVDGSPICRAAWEVPGEPPMIVRTLYALGEPFVRISLEDRERREYGRHVMPAIVKREGVEVPTRFFLEAESRAISAVLFTRDDLWNCPQVHGRPSGNDLVLVHNVHATVPLPRGWLGRGREFFAIGNELHVDDHRPRADADAGIGSRHLLV